jgi:hypothetical protein
MVASANTVDESTQEVALEHDVGQQLVVVGDVLIDERTELRHLIDEPSDGLSFSGCPSGRRHSLAVCPTAPFAWTP